MPVPGVVLPQGQEVASPLPRQAAACLPCLDLKDEEFMWSLQWCTQACSCAENVLDGFIFPSAGQVQTLFSA